MAEYFSLLILIAVAFLALIFWAATLAGVFWDLQRRRLPGSQNLLWLLVTALLPFAGFLAYMLVRWLELRPGKPRDSAPADERARHTIYLGRGEENEPSDTIAAADLLHATIVERDLAGSMRAPFSPAPAFALEVVDGPHAGLRFPLEHLPAVAGRGPEADIRLDQDLGISRQHAEFYLQSGTLHVRDLNSTHGTLVNGRAVFDQLLEPGDRVELGHSSLQVQTRADGTGRKHAR